ncbi:unnamed protein product [Durusdinium trenchii]|uniref:Uncharacterized protein n=2 Tax=Durusdinium trenchii TaxID=1381693 RepID=A0ABP0MWC3_9DINO
MEFGKSLLIYILGIISGLSIVPAVVFAQERLQLHQDKAPGKRTPVPVVPTAPAAVAAAPAAAPTAAPAPAGPVVAAALVVPGQLTLAELRDIWLHLDAPSKLPYEQLMNYEPGRGKFHSQAGQDKWVEKVFSGQRNLFVVESGALNGISHSNSIFFETERQWDCLLVEANPYLWPEVRSRNRKCHFLTAGLSITKDKGEFPFKLAGPLGGFTDTMASSHVWRADHEIKNNAPWMTGSRGSGKVINVSAFPLYQAGRPGRWVPGSTALQLVPGDGGPQPHDLGLLEPGHRGK